MAPDERKPETKKTEQKQTPEVKNLPPLPLPFPYKTCNLKVSIHCEGCKRKVRKILTSIEGVYKVEIDVKQQKVVVMGIASPDILLKKLLKSGKIADILPEIPDPQDKKKNEKKKDEITNAVTSSGSDKPDSEKTEAVIKCSSGDNDEGDSSLPVKEEKKIVHNVEDKKSEENGSGIASKKKKEKGQTLTNNTPPRPIGGPLRTPAADHDRPFIQNDGYQILTNNNLPRPSFPPNYNAPQMMYGVSYNVAHHPQVNVDAASYYSLAPPYSYAYMHPGYLPFDPNFYQPRPSDSFELFNDENPNGCFVM